MQDHYKVLGVKRSATFDEIRTAYLEIRRKVGVNPTGQDSKRASEAGDAWDVLKDSRKRAKYNLELDFGRVSGETIYQKSKAEVKGPRWGGISQEPFGFMDGLFRDSMGMSWLQFSTGVPQDKFYLTRSHATLLSAIIDSYENPKEGTWTIKPNSDDRSKGFNTDYMYELKIKDGDAKIYYPLEMAKEEQDKFNKYLCAMDSLAFKMSEGGKIVVNEELEVINAYSLELWNKGDKRVLGWEFSTFAQQIRDRYSFVEFSKNTSKEGNRKNTERR